MKNWIAYALILISSDLCFAKSTCERAALNASETHLIITMEGLFGGTDGRAAAMARRSIAEASSGATVVPFSYSQYKQAASCAQIWKRLYGDRLKITFVGHSFGGGRGAIPLMQILAAKGIRVDEMLVLDGRVCDQNSGILCREESSCANQGGRTLSRSANVGRVYNFYQCGGGLQGRKFREDGRVQNIQLRSSHIGMPSQPYPTHFLARLLRQNSAPEQSLVPTESADSAEPSNSNLTSWCFKMGGAVRYRCSYEEASQRNYEPFGSR